MKKFLLLLLLACVSIVHTKEFISRTGERIQLEMCREKDLQDCEAIFIRAFIEAYKDFTLEQLAIQDKVQFLKEAFADVFDDAQMGLQQLVVARLNGVIIGFSGFKRTETPHEVYISQLAVDPAHWRQGIGKHLVFSVFSVFEDADHLVVIPRKINAIARRFYEQNGFKESSYIHTGYSAEKYTGYEWFPKL